MAAIAEWESRRIGERIRAALLERRAEGRATNGTAPIGFAKINKRFEPCPVERRLGRRILRLRQQGMYWRDIAAQLTREKTAVRGRRRWTYASVARWGESASAGFPRVGIHTKPWPRH